MRKFESCRPGLRVYANSDSEMQRFESCRPNRPVRLWTHTELGRARRGYCQAPRARAFPVRQEPTGAWAERPRVFV